MYVLTTDLSRLEFSFFPVIDKIVFDINKLPFSKNSNLKLSGPLLYISFEALKLLDFESFLPFFEKIIKIPHIFNLYLICCIITIIITNFLSYNCYKQVSVNLNRY